MSADDCHLKVGRDELKEGDVFQMGSIVFQESIGRFQMKEKQSGRREIQSTRDPLEFQEHLNILLGVACRLHNLILAGGILVMFACAAAGFREERQIDQRL